VSTPPEAAEHAPMTVFDSLILPADEAPACGEHPEDEQPALCCQGWLCNYLRESYASIPGAGKGGLVGSCPVHTWY
jgi:hypothetical protein